MNKQKLLLLLSFAATFSTAGYTQSLDADLAALEGDALRVSVTLVQVQQEREELIMHRSHTQQRYASLSADGAVHDAERDRFNVQCANGDTSRSYDDPQNNSVYQSCIGWRGGLEQRFEVLRQTLATLVRDVDVLRERDSANSTRGAQTLLALLSNSTQRRILCSRLPATRCRSITFDPRIQGMMDNIEVLATRRSSDCLQHTVPEVMAACAGEAFDLSDFELSRHVLWPNFPRPD